MESILDYPGIYGIHFSGTRHFYIGSSKNTLLSRKESHKELLEAGRHFNRYMQNVYDVYPDRFTFIPVEKLLGYSEEEIRSREKDWISFLNPPMNIIKDPTNWFIDNSGEKHGLSKSTNAEISVIKGLVTQGLDWERISKVVDLSAYKDPAGLIKSLRYNQKWENVPIDSRYKTSYKLISPTGDVFFYDNLYLAKKELNIPVWVCGFYSLLRHERTTKDSRLKGWSVELHEIPSLEFIHNFDLLHCQCRVNHLAKRAKPKEKVSKATIDYKRGRNINNRGSNNGTAKLSGADVAQIKGMISQFVPGDIITSMFNIAAPTLSNIRYGKLWPTVKPSSEIRVLYEVTSPGGKKYRYYNLHLFRKKENLSVEVCRFIALIKNQIKPESHYLKGWYCRVIQEPKYKLDKGLYA